MYILGMHIFVSRLCSHARQHHGCTTVCNRRVHLVSGYTCITSAATGGNEDTYYSVRNFCIILNIVGRHE